MPVVVLDSCPMQTTAELQFVDQVETSLFDNRDRYAQCFCAFVSCMVGVSSTAEMQFLGPCTQVQGRGGHVHRHDPRN